MEFKKFWKESLAGFVLKQILLAIIIFVVLSSIALAYINHYTHHGESEKVPNLKGLYVEEARLLLQSHGLYPVVIDSFYTKNVKPGIILEQVPAPNSTVKKNRPIYLVINSRQGRRIPLPEVNDMSYRQADAMLKGVGLNVTSVEYLPSEYKDLVIAVKYRGERIQTGTRLPEGTSIVLEVGSGLGSEELLVPKLKGLKLEQARRSALENSMVIGAIDYDEDPVKNDEEYVIYRQRPTEGQSVPSGTRIDIWLSKDKSLQEKRFDKDDQKTDTDEEFF